MAERETSSDDSVSVVVVDDARFTCEMIRRTLRSEGFHDVRVATTAAEALERLDERQADIVLADWLMPEMDGLALTQRIRDQDRAAERYTYVILLTAKEGVDSLTEAFDQGVDDFIGKGPDHQELVARINAAARIASLQNDLIQAKHHLLELNQQLNEGDSPQSVVGGLGNRNFVTQRLEALIRHVETRDGMGLCGLVRIPDIAGLRQSHGASAVEEVTEGVASRLADTVRPLDVIGRVAEDTFAVLMLHEGDERPHPNIFRRTHNALSLRPYRTTAGFVTVPCAIAITGFNTPWVNRPSAEQLLELTADELDDAYQAGRVIVQQWQQ